jgi:hypothetical protein
MRSYDREGLQMVAVRHLKLATPANVKRTVTFPVRKPNAAYRYLGHKSIQHTVRYTELAPTRFKSLFRD